MTHEGPNGGDSASGRARANDRFDERSKLHCQQEHGQLRARNQFEERLKLKLREGGTQQGIGPGATHPRRTSHTTAPAKQSRHKSADMTDIGAKNVSSRVPTRGIERSQRQLPRGILHAKLERRYRDWQEKINISSLQVYSMDQLPEIDGTLDKVFRRKKSRAKSMSTVKSSSESVRKVDKSLYRRNSMDPAKPSASSTRQIASVPEDAFIEDPSWDDLEGVLHQTLTSSLSDSRTSCNDSEGITDERRSPTIDEVKPKRRSRRKCINPSLAINDIADQPSTSTSSTSSRSSSWQQRPESWEDLDGVLQFVAMKSLKDLDVSLSD